MKMNCLIIDDEPSGRKIIEEYIQEIFFLNLVGTAENPLKALPVLEEQTVDLIFLDIQMPKMNGLDFLRTLKNPPMVILTTAFADYALEGYELDVIDYLLKPVSFERFLKAVSKARDFYDLQQQPSRMADYFFVKHNHRFEKIMFDDLLFVEAANNYVFLQTTSKKMISYLTFKSLEAMLPAEIFMKVHKSFVVSLPKIESLNGEEIQIGAFTIPISRNLKEEVMERVVNKKVVKR